ncbi:MAG: N-acetyl-gamma-glutamyl-phosphate reductase [Chitinivibrionales bacterium]|nr:N-acetyl-gamma-glutamyl-phosphate reductase [Chitinivibrionales bacterium]
MNPIKIGILGATSYTGLECIRLVRRHGAASIEFISSRSHAGKKITDIFPQLKGVCENILIAPEDAGERDIDCLFSCLPHAVSAQYVLPFIRKGIAVIDLSADFRIKDAAAYEKWYATKHPAPDLLAKAVFGLPEYYREEIAHARIIANPGCYPTSILLPLLPLLKDSDCAVEQPIIADSKSGVSGAGRTLKLTSHYFEANENISAYSPGRKHRHIAEIDQELSRAAEQRVRIIFSPHLIPVSRGILSTIYLRTNKSAIQCQKIVEETYKNEPFVRVRNQNDLPCTRAVAYTNYCDISFAGGVDGAPVIAVSAIDNLLKGASGQAVQNMNIMFGFDEREGLK